MQIIQVEKSLVMCLNVQIQDAKNQRKQGTSFPLRLVCYFSTPSGFIYLHKFRPRDMEGKYKGLGTSALLSHRIILNAVLLCQNDVALSSALVVSR